MNKLTYKNITDKNKVIKHKTKRAILSFLGGGCIALLGQGFYDLFYYAFNQDSKTSVTLMLVTII